MPATSAPVALGLGGIAALFLISGIQGKSVNSILQGDFGEKHDPSFKGGEGLPAQGGKGTTEPIAGAPPGMISPFPKSTKLIWGKSDQGIDGTVTPGSPMVAMEDGEVTISHDPPGFGANYPVLHTAKGSFYYGHSVPAVPNGTKVKKGQVIAHANTNGQGNATTPGAFEVGKWPPGSYATAGAAIREWFIHLPRL